MEHKRMGLIAGAGDLPVMAARSAYERGHRVISVALSRELKKPLEPFSERVYCCGIGQPNRIFRLLLEEGIRDVLIIGKINKRIMFSRFRFDARALSFLRKIRNRDDDSLMRAVEMEFMKEGLNILDQRAFLEDLCPEMGLICGKGPDRDGWMDILYGYSVAKKVGEVGVGQTVVVKDRAVLAIETIEGTDEAIRRGCKLCGGGAVVVKVTRPHQDLRWDLPVVGSETIKVMAKGRASILAIEAGKTFLVDQVRLMEMADKAGISVVAIDEATLEEKKDLVK